MTVYVPDANEDDTVNVHVKVPVAEVVWELHVCVVGATPLSVIEPNVMLTENPEPVTVTEVPTGAWVTDRAIVGVVTVKVAEAVSAGTVPTSLPDTTTVYGPVAMDGTMNVHVKAPVAEVV
jgi:formaldehyde-activating enzyme involved in methanogenesis